MIWVIKVVGQLKRKGKFDTQSEYMKSQLFSGYRASNPQGKNAIGSPNAGVPDANLSLLGNPNSKNILDDINGNMEMPAGGNVGTYKPTEFPLESKLLMPSYALEPASPSSDLSQFMTPEESTGNSQQ